MSPMKRRRCLRTPVERVGMLPNADLPPPALAGTHGDAVLVRALRDRDEHAFRRVIDRYFSPMIRLARVYVRTRDEAEEVVQETWLAALRGIGGFRGTASIRTWLFQILRNRARSRGRRCAREVPFSQLEAAGPTAAKSPEPLLETAHSPTLGTAPPAPDEALLEAELRAQVERALNHLPPRQAEIIVLRDLEGWSSEELRESLGLSAENQRVLLHRARARMRELLRPYLRDGQLAAAELVA